MAIIRKGSETRRVASQFVSAWLKKGWALASTAAKPKKAEKKSDKSSK